ncbi:MAG: rod shape-determining protein, partial [Eubacterium sp.]|nr:rod shape-determining protein [Eubacterium sp.]
MTNKEELVFGLDIGTRSIVGTVGYRKGAEQFVVVAQESIEHTTRAVIDGQIHDIVTVSNTIREIKERLEERTHMTLRDVSIAAAGRVLKTKQVHAVYEFSSDTKVTKDHIRSLDMLGVEMAYDEIRKDSSNNGVKFFCVGYSAVKYYLNDYPMEMIEMHTASSIGVDLIATFLPEEVVDGLYSSVENAGLRVANLTLEPIAAIQVAIPEKFRLLNIALVDVGAGTSDISIVKDGSIVAFGMIPVAGDEITEAIAQRLLIDFSTAENIKRQYERRKVITYKNIFGEKVKVEKELIAEIVEQTSQNITKKVAERIIKLNGNKPVSAVFVVGGGGKHEGFTHSLAEHLELPDNRVAIRGAEVLGNVIFEQEGIRKDSTLVTPIGICLSFYDSNSNFIHVMVNDQRVKLYDNGKATVLDACISFGFSKENLFPTKGKTIHYTINGEERTAKGRMGEVASIRKNGRQVSLNELVKENDTIKIKAATRGEDGTITVADIPECKNEIAVKVFGRTVLCPYTIEVNGEMKSVLYDVKDGDDVRTYDYFSVGTLFDYIDMEKPELILLNGSEAGMNAKVKDGDVITRCPVRKEEQE